MGFLRSPSIGSLWPVPLRHLSWLGRRVRFLLVFVMCRLLALFVLCLFDFSAVRSAGSPLHALLCSTRWVSSLYFFLHVFACWLLLRLPVPALPAGRYRLFLLLLALSYVRALPIACVCRLCSKSRVGYFLSCTIHFSI